MINKDSIRLTHSDGMWLCEILSIKNNTYLNGWAWSKSAKQAINLAINNIKNV